MQFLVRYVNSAFQFTYDKCIKNSSQVVGIVTRKDLLPGHIAKFDRFQNSSVECIDGSEAPLTSYERRKSGAKGNITLDGLNC